MLETLVKYLVCVMDYVVCVMDFVWLLNWDFIFFCLLCNAVLSLMFELYFYDLTLHGRWIQIS